jgi:tetratricopeptide (TPR) repeat protein
VKKIFSGILLVVAIVIIYAPALRNGFVWDDTALILRDPLIRSWRLIPEGFQHFLFTDATASDFYRPIQRLTYTFDYALYPLAAWGYHLTSILWQAGAALALMFCANELLQLCGVDLNRRRLVSFAAALVWAVHPIHSAAVAYISGRADPLAACFGFLGIAAALRSVRAEGGEQWKWWFVAAASFLMGALSKEMALMFLVVLLVIFTVRRRWKPLVGAGAVAIVVAVIYLSLRLSAEHITPPVLHAPAPLLVRPIIVARAFAEYASVLALPLNLHVERDVETHPTGFSSASLTDAAWHELQTLAGVVLLALAITWLIRARKRDPAVFLCLLLFFTTYIPVSGVVALNATAAEHWMYVPSAFLFIAVALAISNRLPRVSNALLKTTAAVALGAWVLFLGGRTFARCFDWKDQRTFFERTIASGGHSVRMLINLGGLELNEGHLDAAKAHLEEALRKEPEQPFAIINLAAVALRQNDYKSAHELLSRATSMPLIEAQAHEMLAVLEKKETGNVNLLRLRLASRTGPPNWAIEKRYVSVLNETGNTDKAIEELRACLRTQWYRAETWLMLSQLLEQTGDTKAAAEARQKAEAYDVHLAARPLPL